MCSYRIVLLGVLICWILLIGIGFVGVVCGCCFVNNVGLLLVLCSLVCCMLVEVLWC